MTKTELESDDFFLSIIPLPLHIKEHNFLIIGLPVAPQLWNGLFPSKKDKMVDGSTRGHCVFHSGHFRTSCEKIWKSIWNEHRIIASSYSPYSLRRMIVEIQFSTMLLACPGAAETMPSHGPTGKLQLVAILSLYVKGLSSQEKNILFVDRPLK